MSARRVVTGASVQTDSITARARYGALHRISAQIEMSCPSGPFIPEHLESAAKGCRAERALCRSANHARGNLKDCSGPGGASQHVCAPARQDGALQGPTDPAAPAPGLIFLLGWTFLFMSGLKPERPDGFSLSVAMENRPVVGKPNKGHLCFRRRVKLTSCF